MSATHRSGRSSSAGDRRAGVGGHPHRAGVDQPGRARPAPRRRPASAGHGLDLGAGPRSDSTRACAAVSSGSTTSSRRTPSRTSACATAVPAPPAPSSTTRSQVGVGQPVAERPAEAGDVGVVPDRQPVRTSDGVQRADRGHLGATPSTSGTIACLTGWVTLRPSKPSSTAAPAAAAGARGRAGRRPGRRPCRRSGAPGAPPRARAAPASATDRRPGRSGRPARSARARRHSPSLSGQVQDRVRPEDDRRSTAGAAAP